MLASWKRALRARMVVMSVPAAQVYNLLQDQITHGAVVHMVVDCSSAEEPPVAGRAKKVVSDLVERLGYCPADDGSPLGKLRISPSSQPGELRFSSPRCSGSSSSSSPGPEALCANTTSGAGTLAC